MLVFRYTWHAAAQHSCWATFKKSLGDKMCVTRRSRPPTSVKVDKFVNTSAIYGALRFIWHFVPRYRSPTVFKCIFYSWSHIYIVIKINVSKLRSRLVFPMSVIAQNVSRCCVKDGPLPSVSSLSGGASLQQPCIGDVRICHQGVLAPKPTGKWFIMKDIINSVNKISLFPLKNLVLLGLLTLIFL